MRKATALWILAAAALASAPAMADTALPEAVSGLTGHATYDLTTGIVQWDSGPSVQAAVDKYSNIHSPPIFGFSSPDLNAEFGDRVTTTGTGILDEHDFTIYNSTASFGEMYSCQFQLNFYNAATNAPLGGYLTGLIQFGAYGMFPGYFSIVSVTGLAALNINLNTTDILVTQRVVNPIGYQDRLGIISQDPPALGSSASNMFIHASSVGPAGYYTIGSPALNANPGYRIATLAPVPADAATWGKVKAGYR